MTQENAPRTDNPAEFRPLDAHIKVKVRFWQRQRENPLVDPATVTQREAITVTGDQRLASWWSVPGFQDWFCNRDEFQERAEYLVVKALHRAEAILENDDPKVVAAQVQLIKAIIEASGRGPAQKREVKYLDADVGKLDKEQLRALVDRQIKVVTPKSVKSAK